MSGLASVGSIVGSGAIAGVGILAAGPAIATTVAMDSVLADDPNLNQKERDARMAGRTASKAGVIVGGVGTIGTIGAAGTAAGLSSAGITSGLAAIGATIGGGMAAGTTIAIVALAAFAAGTGYGVYKAWKWCTED